MARATSPRDGDRHQSDRSGAGDQQHSARQSHRPAPCARRCRADRESRHSARESLDRFSRYCVGMITNSAKQPSASMPMIFTFWQRCGWPMRQGRQWPQLVHLRADEIAGLHRSDFRADFFDVRRRIHGQRSAAVDARGRPAIPIVDMQIGSANRSRAHTHQNFAGSGSRNRNGFEIRAARGARLAQGFHR